MTPRLMLSLSAAGLAVAGLATLFLPGLIALILALDAAAIVPIQLAGAGFLALATLNWLGRDLVRSGLCGRPIVMPNVVFGVVLAGTAASASVEGRVGIAGWVLFVMFAGHAAAFWWLGRRAPDVETDPSAARR